MKAEVEVKTFKCAEFELWMPNGPVQLNGILVLTPGSNDDGRYWIKSDHWRVFAEQSGLALVGCHFKDTDPTIIEGYADAKVESGDALNRAIAMFEDEHPELIGLPLYLWGFSAGGQFSYEYNANFPKRVAAWIANKGGIYYTALCQKAARMNPGLMFVGEYDAEYRTTILIGLYYINKVARHCNWEMISEKCSHDLGDSVSKSMEFFRKVIKARKEEEASFRDGK